MKSKILALVLVVSFCSASAQKPKPTGESRNIVNSQGLVVGIVIDQMRYDYLYRFWSKYSDGGFKRLVNEGFVFENANYNYVPTYTAPGHACIYTGTTPAYNGIISNEWYDRNTGKSIYCVGDSTVSPVGTTSISGKMSPRNLLTTTITDELELATNREAKVIGIALKDRGAILPAGHVANAAYWHDPYSNNWITSTYYLPSLPSWADEFNKRKMIDSLLKNPWTTLLPIEQYTESTEDDNRYEGLYDGEKKPVFPHNLPALRDSNSELIRETPFGNTLTKEFAIAAIRGENLGKGKSTDFLSVSFSSTDYVGHMFGTNAIELEDTYIRLDRDLAALLKFLDEWTGNNYILFLTADHGAGNNVEFSKDRRLQTGRLENKEISDALKQYLSKQFGSDSLVLNAGANNIFLNRNNIEAKKIKLEDVQDKCVSFVTSFKGIAVAKSATELARGNCKTGLAEFMQNGFHAQRSSDVMIQMLPGWNDWYVRTGTTHGTGYSYDTHVPLIFFGKKIKSGRSAAPVTVCDIAPTLSTILNIEFPSGNTGKPLLPVLSGMDR